MNISMPPKHPWQPQQYKHLTDAEQAEWTRILIDLLNSKFELMELRDKLKLFDDSHAHLIDHIHIIYGKPPRTSLTLDGLEIAHLIADAPKIEASDHEPNRVTVTLLSRKLTVENDI